MSAALPTKRVFLGGVLGAGVVLAAGLLPGAASAGAKLSAVVSIDTSARRASGGVASTRAHSVIFDRDAYIGCWSFADASGPQAGCQAKRGSTSVSCTVDPTNLGKLQDFTWAMGLMGPNSHIEFTWNSSNRCQMLKVTIDSRYGPKAL